MEQYHNLVRKVLTEGSYKENRTGIDTVSFFNYNYSIDLQEGFPLLTTKNLSGSRWESLVYELLWYISGEEHIENLKEHTAIWNAWADDQDGLETAYGRFWRRFPIPEDSNQLWCEAWANENTEWHNEDGTFDQIQYAIDQLRNNENSRRIVISAWHPANATVSRLPPCHYSFAFNVQNGKLNTHLTQRSGDIALGIPFNIASYSLLTHIIAQQVGLEVGEFGHTIIDAHIYCGEGERGRWYHEALPKIQNSFDPVFELMERLEDDDEYIPEDPDNLDHVPGLLEQINREPRQLPEIEVADKGIDEIKFDDIELKEYDPHPGIKFGVAE